MTFQGMDTAAGQTFGDTLRTRGTRLRELADELRASTGSVIGTMWIGPDADAFDARATPGAFASLQGAADLIAQRADELVAQVDEQDSASDDLGGSAPGGGSSSGSGTSAATFLGADWSDVSWGEFGDNLWSSLGLDGVDVSGGLISATHSFADRFSLAAFGQAAPRFIPLVGDVYTGVMAGIDRWNDDADRDDLNIWERIGRAGLDGGANFGGSLLGGTLLGSAGAAIGSAIGGGGGAAAGAPAAGVGAIPGAIGGASAGGVVGGIIGDVVGSYLGASVADAAIDTFLD